MTTQNQEDRFVPNPDQQFSQSNSAHLDCILAAVAATVDGTFIGDRGRHAWGWDRAGMWEKYGRVRLSVSFDIRGCLEDATIVCEHIVVGLVQGAAFDVLGHEIDNPRDTSGDLHCVLSWIENIETILDQPSIDAVKNYLRGLQNPGHRHAWILWDETVQIAHCTDWFCQARFYPASGVLGAEVTS